MLRTSLLLAVCVLLALVGQAFPAEPGPDARARAALALANAGAIPCHSAKMAVKPDAQAVTRACPCSTECVCGCNQGGPCDCSRATPRYFTQLPLPASSGFVPLLGVGGGCAGGR